MKIWLVQRRYGACIAECNVVKETAKTYRVCVTSVLWGDPHYLRREATLAKADTGVCQCRANAFELMRTHLISLRDSAAREQADASRKLCDLSEAEIKLQCQEES